jgi:hypothetical protein
MTRVRLHYVDLLRNYSPNRELQGYGNNSSFGVEFFVLDSQSSPRAAPPSTAIVEPVT